MSIRVRDERISAVVDTDAARTTISEAFQFIEGPIWHPTDQHLTFSDIPGNRLYRYVPGGDVEIYREPTDMANGNTYDRQGRILSCLHATSRVVRESDGVLEVLASHQDGKELNSPNDIVVKSDDTIWFTDPTFGREGSHGVKRPVDLDFRGVYRIDPDGSMTCVWDDFDQPNGLCFSPDEQFLYVADTMQRHVRRFRVDGGSLSGGEVFCSSPAPDGLKVDSEGFLYAGGPSGVGVYHTDGTFLGVFETPEFCANFTWGGPDLKTLYLTASTGLYSYPVKVAGIPLF